jgi:hypothetical protein
VETIIYNVPSRDVNSGSPAGADGEKGNTKGNEGVADWGARILTRLGLPARDIGLPTNIFPDWGGRKAIEVWAKGGRKMRCRG